MTNSTPKLNDKVERQGSPNTGGKRHHRTTSAIKSATYFSNGGGRRNTNSGRLSCSPPCSAVSVKTASQSSSSTSSSTRSSPLRYENISPRGSPTNSFYAGAKFSEPPSPASLPKPPTHWMATRLLMMNTCQQMDRSSDISNHLKILLNVQA